MHTELPYLLPYARLEIITESYKVLPKIEGEKPMNYITILTRARGINPRFAVIVRNTSFLELK